MHRVIDFEPCQEFTHFDLDAVELLETIRSCFTSEEDVAGDLYRKWKEMKTS